MYMGYITGISFWKDIHHIIYSMLRKKLKLLNKWQEQLKVGKATQDNQNQLHILSMKQCFFYCKIFLE